MVDKPRVIGNIPSYYIPIGDSAVGVIGDLSADSAELMVLSIKSHRRHWYTPFFFEIVHQLGLFSIGMNFYLGCVDMESE